MTAGTFTQRILAELAPHPPQLACCRAALVEGMTLTAGTGAAISTARLVSARAALQALHLSGLTAHVVRVNAPRATRYRVDFSDDESVLQASARLCCARSRVRGAFLAAGRVNAPDAVPHLEIDCRDRDAAARIAADAARLGIAVQVAGRRGHWLVLARSAASVAALLTSIGAHSGRLEFEEGRVVREVRGEVNRRLNAETANLRRSVGAGLEQVDAIESLMADPARWDGLAPALREAAELRLRDPAAPLQVLAERAGCSRSAMAGRLHRLVGLAAGPG